MTRSIYSVKEAAKHYGVSERRIRKLLEEGRLSGEKIGRDWVLFKLGDYGRKLRGKDKKPRKGGK